MVAPGAKSAVEAADRSFGEASQASRDGPDAGSSALPCEDGAVGLSQLHALHAVAATGSGAAAAGSLCRGRSSVWRQIRRLESRLGLGLLQRGPHGWVPSASGAIVLVRATRVELEMCRLQARLSVLGAAISREKLRAALASVLSYAKPELASLTFERRWAAMENELGIALLKPASASAELTDAGRAVAFHSRRMLFEVRQVLPDLRADQGDLVGEIRIGLLAPGRGALMPAAFLAMTQRYPLLRLLTTESPYEALVASLHCGDLDLVVGPLRSPRLTAGLVQEVLFEDRLELIARAGHPLARRKPGELRDLGDSRWVLAPRGVQSRDLLDAAFAAAGLPAPVVSVEAEDPVTLRGMLLSTDMITAASPLQLDRELAQGHLMRLGVPVPGATCEIGIAWRIDGLPGAGAAVLIEELRRVAANTALRVKDPR